MNFQCSSLNQFYVCQIQYKLRYFCMVRVYRLDAQWKRPRGLCVSDALNSYRRIRLTFRSNRITLQMKRGLQFVSSWQIRQSLNSKKFVWYLILNLILFSIDQLKRRKFQDPLLSHFHYYSRKVTLYIVDVNIWHDSTWWFYFNLNTIWNFPQYNKKKNNEKEICLWSGSSGIFTSELKILSKFSGFKFRATFLPDWEMLDVNDIFKCRIYVDLWWLICMSLFSHSNGPNGQGQIDILNVFILKWILLQFFLFTSSVEYSTW